MIHQIKTEEDFEQLFREMYVPLCRKVFRILKDEEASEDLVQDLFVKLWEKKNDLTITTAIQPYLYRAVVNAAFNHIRKTNPFSEFDSSLHDKAETTGTSEVLEYRETAQKVSSIIDNLPPACRTVFLLSREDGLSYKEIAETLSISVKTVENQMTKALRLLRENLLEILFLIISSLIFY